jgi:hypothetical protein
MKFVKTALSVAFSAVALFAAAGAQANVISYAPATEANVGRSTPVTFMFDFKDHGFVQGVTDYISGSLHVVLADSNADETGTLKIGAQTLNFSNLANKVSNNAPRTETAFDIVLDAKSLATLNADGMIEMKVTSTGGDFYFWNSALTLQTADTTDVPEPMSLALIGVGLLGVGAARRRRNAK